MADYPNKATPQPTGQPTAPQPDPQVEAEKRKLTITLSIAGVLIVLFIIAAVYLLLQPGTPTDKIRDVFIIFMALESLIIGAALVVLIVQLASLINLLNNEVKPILDATNETINTLRGTTEFLSENLVEPVMKLNSYLAGLQRLFEMVGMKKK
jgi:amino acid permease